MDRFHNKETLTTVKVTGRALTMNTSALWSWCLGPWGLFVKCAQNARLPEDPHGLVLGSYQECQGSSLPVFPQHCRQSAHLLQTLHIFVKKTFFIHV